MFDEKAVNRNANLMILEGTLFWAGLSFLQGDTVVTNFIRLTTGSAALAGLAATIKSLMWLTGQFAIGLFFHRFRAQSRTMGIIGFICRPMVLLMALIMAVGLTGPAAAWGFLTLYALFFLTDGMLSLCWAGINARTLPLKRRGEVMSIQQTYAGLAGLASGWALRSILGSAMTFQMQYAVIFALAGGLMILDAVVLSRIRDIPHPCAPDMPPIHPVRYIRRLMPILKRDLQLRDTLIARILYTVTLVASPINLMFGRDAGLTESQLATLVFMPVAGQIISGVLWAQVSRRASYPVMMRLAQALGVFCALTNILCFFMEREGMPVMGMLSVAMILVTINTYAVTGFYQHMISLTDEDGRADTIVLAALVLAPLSFATYLAGAVVERFGYLPVYLAMLAAGILGWILVGKRIPVTAK
jgi:MFS family permease